MEEGCFILGFERSEIFERLYNRLQTLEAWRELAIRPDVSYCDPVDLDLLDCEVDDCTELDNRCELARKQMNENLPRIEQALDDELEPKESTVPEAGLGLFYMPTDLNSRVKKGTTLCYYTGHLHNYRSARRLINRDYLMLIGGDVLVDSGPLPSIKARYINDPLNDQAVNCLFVPQVTRSAVVATRDIKYGEELLASYGDGYWSQQKCNGRSIP